MTREQNWIKEKFQLDKESYILFLCCLVREKGVSYLVEVVHEEENDKKLVITSGCSNIDAFTEESKERTAGNKQRAVKGLLRDSR